MFLALGLAGCASAPCPSLRARPAGHFYPTTVEIQKNSLTEQVKGFALTEADLQGLLSYVVQIEAQYRQCAGGRGSW
jgi:hypothetical protein